MEELAYIWFWVYYSVGTPIVTHTCKYNGKTGNIFTLRSDNK